MRWLSMAGEPSIMRTPSNLVGLYGGLDNAVPLVCEHVQIALATS